MGAAMNDVKEALAQHAELRLEGDRLRILAHCPEGLLADERLSRVWEHSMAKFLGQLRDHFAFEERGGYMADVASGRPELQGKISTLKDEHGSFTIEAETLLALSRDPRADPDDGWGRLSQRLVKLLEALEHHERAENTLMQKFMCEDLGGGA